NYLFRSPLPLKLSDAPWIAHSLQIVCALAAGAMRPRSFEDLINAFLFALLGFVSFSAFYSPQYLLWILPLICFSSSIIMLISAVLLSWLTYLFPVSYFLLPRLFKPLFKAAVVAVGLLRLFMMCVIVKEYLIRRQMAPAMSAARNSER